MADVIVDDQGTVCAFEFQTDEALNWLDENVEYEGWQWLGGRLIVDHRPAYGLAEAFQQAGFTVAVI